jgi:hypothetical protein
MLRRDYDNLTNFMIKHLWRAKMMPLAATLAVVLSLIGALGLNAAAQVTKGEICFCLKRKSTGSTEHLGCKRKLAPNAYTPEVSCIHSNTGSEYKPTSFEAIDEVAGGKDGCNPCVPLIMPVRGQDHIRGQE